jgi:hypothetical protein
VLSQLTHLCDTPIPWIELGHTVQERNKFKEDEQAQKVQTAPDFHQSTVRASKDLSTVERASHTLLADLGTLVKSRVRLQEETGSEFYELTQTTPLQQRALELLSVTL